MRIRAATAIAALGALWVGSALANPPQLQVVSCETGQPVAGVQTDVTGPFPAEIVAYRVSAPGFVTRNVSLEWGSSSEECLEPTHPQTETETETPSMGETEPSRHPTSPQQTEHGDQRDGPSTQSDDPLLQPLLESADDRAHDGIDDRQPPPAVWVDPGPEENVDGQIEAIGELLQPPPRSRPRPRPSSPTATPTPTVAPPPALDLSELDPTLKLVQDDTGLYHVQDVAAAKCEASDAMAGARGRALEWGPVGSLCGPLNDFKARTAQREEAKRQGKDPDKVAPYTPAESRIKDKIDWAIERAIGSATADCGRKIRCKKLGCTTTCDVVFQKMVDSVDCKVKSKRRAVRKKKSKRGENNNKKVPHDRLRVNVIGNCDCSCNPGSACEPEPAVCDGCLAAR